MHHFLSLLPHSFNHFTSMLKFVAWRLVAGSMRMKFAWHESWAYFHRMCKDEVCQNIGSSHSAVRFPPFRYVWEHGHSKVSLPLGFRWFCDVNVMMSFLPVTWQKPLLRRRPQVNYTHAIHECESITWCGLSLFLSPDELKPKPKYVP